MSFPERLRRSLNMSQCPALHRLCPICGSIQCSKDLNQIDSNTFQRIPVERLNMHLTSISRGKGCKSIFYTIGNAQYVACIAFYGYSKVAIEKGVTAVYHSRFDEYICDYCTHEFRLMLPVVEIPSPYLSEFSMFPCMHEALQKRNRRP